MNRDSRVTPVPKKPSRVKAPCYIPPQPRPMINENPLDYELRVTQIGHLNEKECKEYMQHLIDEAKNPTPRYRENRIPCLPLVYVGFALMFAAFATFLFGHFIAAAFLLFSSLVCIFLGAMGRTETQVIPGKAHANPQWVIDPIESYEKAWRPVPPEIKAQLSELKARLPKLEIGVLYFNEDPFIKVTHKDSDGKTYSRYTHQWGEPGFGS